MLHIYIYIWKVSSYYIGVSPGYLVPLIKFSCIARYSKVIKRRGSIFGILAVAIVPSYGYFHVSFYYFYSKRTRVKLNIKRNDLSLNTTIINMLISGYIYISNE